MTRRTRLKKRWGQHHLLQPHLCQPMVERLEPEGRTVLEIGPGGGVLTRLLIDAGANVLGIEVDMEWAVTLPGRLGQPAGWLAVADAMELDLARIPAGVRVAGNLPYNVATTLIVDLAERAELVDRAAFLVQREVAQRLSSEPGRRSFGAVSVLVQNQCRVTALGDLRPGAFRPPPKVHSTMILLERHPPLVPAERLDAFRSLVKTGFGQKRKTLVNALGRSYGKSTVTAALRGLGLDPLVRAEAISVPLWAELSGRLHPV